MKIFFKKYCTPEGQGNIGYGEPLVVPPGTHALNNADSGLSVDITGLIAQLGQSLNAPGDPGQLLRETIIPMKGFPIFFGNDDAITPSFVIWPDIGLAGLSNPGGTADFEINGGGNFFDIATQAGLIVFTFNNVGKLIYHSVSKIIEFFGFDQIGIPSFSANIRQVSGVASFLIKDHTLIVDTSSGNALITVDPVAIGTGIGNIKKKGADGNSITVTPVTGSIFGNAGAQPSFVFSGAGESIGIQSDGVNIYIL